MKRKKSRIGLRSSRRESRTMLRIRAVSKAIRHRIWDAFGVIGLIIALVWMFQLLAGGG
jgi:cell division septal protein FtsQ